MEIIRNSRFLLVVGLALFVLALWSIWGLWQDANAHSIGWKWDTSSSPLVTNYDTPHTTEIKSARADYNSNTDLTVNWCHHPCSENILHIYQYVGNVDWAGGADSYSNGQQCQVDITCNETTKKVTSGVVVWNSAHGPYTDSYANYLARHEMGHIFGLKHAPCMSGGDYGGGNGYLSVMTVSCTYDAPDTLQPHDKSDINSKY